MRKTIIIHLIAALFLAAFAARNCSFINQSQITPQSSTQIKSSITIVHDTITIHDTIENNFPIPTNSITLRDTLIIRDTVSITLPIQQLHYKTRDYQAWVSGIYPKLDSIHLFTNTTNYHTNLVSENQAITTVTMPQTKTNPKRFALGLQIGYGLTISQTPSTNIFSMQPSPYIGVGVSYRLFNF